MFNKSYASVLSEDFLNEHKNTLSISEFRKTPWHYKLWLLIMHNHNSKTLTTMESIIIHLSRNASRKTVSNTITMLEQKKLIIKKKDISDNRVIIIEPTEKTIREFKEWIHHLKFELNSVEE